MNHGWAVNVADQCTANRRIRNWSHHPYAKKLWEAGPIRLSSSSRVTMQMKRLSGAGAR